MEPVFFATAAELRAWFERHHEEAPELLVGYYKKHTGKPTVQHTEAIEQALCFGWIDSIGRRIDDERHQVRFTPRRKGSVWSAINYEQPADAVLDDAQTARFQGEEGAWRWFSAQSASYRRAAVHWVVSAKRAETRERRLIQLITDSAEGRTVPPLTRR
jgi:uncharacterized protein YdeI (YjbR/CyaY-like superfamily)